jgi:hypothetical protein
LHDGVHPGPSLGFLLRRAHPGELLANGHVNDPFFALAGALGEFSNHADGFGCFNLESHVSPVHECRESEAIQKTVDCFTDS